MYEILISIMLVGGSFFILLSAIGILRMPDLYMRISATTKAVTLGVGLISVAAALFFGSIDITSKAVLIVFFLFLTAPVAGHILARAGFYEGAPLWEGSKINEFADFKKDEEKDATSS
ncbi:MAG: Na+/H+ antiporter subunit G [Caldithrix sp.]|nr:Na+/H+ antiporter subunit G [Caldithrix sp.]